MRVHISMHRASKRNSRTHTQNFLVLRSVLLGLKKGALSQPSPSPPRRFPSFYFTAHLSALEGGREAGDFSSRCLRLSKLLSLLAKSKKSLGNLFCSLEKRLLAS